MSVLPDPKGDVDAELEFHLETTIAELVESGYSPESAREEAHRRFGDLERYRSELQSISRKRVAKARRAEWWFIQRQNFAYAARGLRRLPRAHGSAVTARSQNQLRSTTLTRRLLRCNPFPHGRVQLTNNASHQ